MSIYHIWFLMLLLGRKRKNTMHEAKQSKSELNNYKKSHMPIYKLTRLYIHTYIHIHTHTHTQNAFEDWYDLRVFLYEINFLILKTLVWHQYAGRVTLLAEGCRGSLSEVCRKTLIPAVVAVDFWSFKPCSNSKTFTCLSYLQKVLRDYNLREKAQAQHQTYALGIKEVTLTNLSLFIHEGTHFFKNLAREISFYSQMSIMS